MYPCSLRGIYNWDGGGREKFCLDILRRHKEEYFFFLLNNSSTFIYIRAMGAAYVYHYYILFISIISILMIYINLNGWDSGSVGWREKMENITRSCCVWTCLRFIISGHYSYTSTVTMVYSYVHIMYSTIRTMHKRYVCTYVDKYLYNHRGKLSLIYIW